MKSTTRLGAFGIVAMFYAGGSIALAGAHTWDVWEVFSNADGTVQFIEIHEANGTNAETGIGGQLVVVNPSGSSFAITHGVVAPTGLKSFLLATCEFKALPGAPTPDDIIPDNFIRFSSDTQAKYGPYDTANWTAGAIPTNGTSSLSRTVAGGALTAGLNSPKNYAGATAAIDASVPGPLPGVPDGLNGPAMLVHKLAADGSSLELTWDTATCTDANDHQILYGQRSGFPAIPGGTYALQGGTCNIGSASPYTWTSTPNAVDGFGLTWFLVVTKNANGTEGSWGTRNGVNERNGTGSCGTSGVCATTSKSLSNSCGH